MACLNLSNGTFAGLTWSSNASTNIGDVTITRDATSISIQKVGFAGSLNLTGDYRYVVYGAANFVALLRIQESLGSSTRTAYILDATGSSLTTQQVHAQGTVSNSVQLPMISHCLGSASLTFIWSGTGTTNEVNTLSIVRSDNGDTVLVALGPKSGINGTISAEVTASQLIIHHPRTSGSDTTTGSRPEGSLAAIPASQDFGEAVLGAANPTLATVTRTFTLRNDGDDCLTVSAISNDPPYSVSAASLALLPIELDPGEEQDIAVVFTPATAGNYNGRTLNITRSPANGTASLNCNGEARDAEPRINTSRSTINFGIIEHPGMATQTFTVSNTGEIDVDITILPAPVGSAFNWTAVTGQPLPVGGTAFTVTATFNTPGDFAAPAQTITVTPTEGAAGTVTLNGAGCVANAEIMVPAIAPLDFGQIERGFRTVRFIEITNTGDAELNFRARIAAGADPAQATRFGLVLPDNDITDAPDRRNYTVLPTVRCGSGVTGPNSVALAVSFFADGASATNSASLVIDQHNADNFLPTQTWTFPLTAEVIDPAPVDAVLVLDRSGSMNDIIGERNKMEAALAAGRLFVQMLRDSADDRAAVVAFDTAPQAVQGMLPVAGNRPTFMSALSPANFTPNGWTNLAGGAIVGKNAFIPHPASPPDLKKAMIVLTDGMENRCFQDGGTTWYSITGRDATDPPDGMRRPDGTLQDTVPWPTPSGIKIYGIGLGNPTQTDSGALDALSNATGAAYADVIELKGKDFFLLEKYFTQIFMETAGLALISDPFFTINPGDLHEHEFDIFPADVNTMVVLYDEPGRRLPFHIVSPHGEVFSGASLPPGFGLRFHSTETARFAEILFPKGKPDRYAGRWKAVIEHEKIVCEGPISRGDEGHKGRAGNVGPGFLPEKCYDYKESVDYGIAIGAGSNLRMQSFIEPGVKYVGESIRLIATISEAGLPVKGATVKVRVETPFGTTHHLTLRDDGSSQDGQADDGEYGGLFLNTLTAGTYRFLFRAEGVQAGKVPIAWVREAERTKAVYDLREPPRVGDSAGAGDGLGCCNRLVRLMKKQIKMLKKIAKEVED